MAAYLFELDGANTGQTLCALVPCNTWHLCLSEKCVANTEKDVHSNGGGEGKQLSAGDSAVQEDRTASHVLNNENPKVQQCPCNVHLAVTADLSKNSPKKLYLLEGL